MDEAAASPDKPNRCRCRATPPIALRDTYSVGRFRALVLAVTGVIVLVGCSGHSSSIHLFGRTYDRGGLAPMTWKQAQSRFGPDIVVVANGKRVSGQIGQDVPTVVVVRDGARYYDYALEGGP
jgi:hypothetical protein